MKTHSCDGLGDRVSSPTIPMSSCWVNRLGSGLAGERLGVGTVVNTSPLPLLPTLDAGGKSYWVLFHYNICCQLYTYLHQAFLTFKRLGWYLNFCTWIMKNILFEQKQTKLWNKRHFVENQRLCSMSWKCSNFPCCLNIYNWFLGLHFIHAFAYTNAGCLKVNVFIHKNLQQLSSKIVCNLHPLFLKGLQEKTINKGKWQLWESNKCVRNMHKQNRKMKVIYFPLMPSNIINKWKITQYSVQ
jgi:hypothetical protein